MPFGTGSRNVPKLASDDFIAAGPCIGRVRNLQSILPFTKNIVLRSIKKRGLNDTIDQDCGVYDRYGTRVLCGRSFLARAAIIYHDG